MINLFVLAFLYTNEGNILLIQRNAQQDFAPLLYSLPGGKVEPGETALQALVREIQEETDLSLKQSDLQLIHTLHRKGTETEFIALCFKANISHLPQPKLMEHNKHDDLQFFSLHDLPKNIIPAHQQIIECVQNNKNYSEHGW